ncbi:hypothetical protein GGR28_001872 [Lewinella aquimaris]|uniref:Secretion system C-terminal sorting domain-containing protein n=1 Tax=Neolewinella aquimaris TaxID=1835722 RepID=A0A840E6A2_9BACT|nr:T9SS type A sorting domain-containing protein [Neolewinella aquimaris]MBB4079252.1 hypothetical protein [Neolewinella aquimaris]
MATLSFLFFTSIPAAAFSPGCGSGAPITYLQDDSDGDGLVVMEAENPTSSAGSTYPDHGSDVAWWEYSTNSASNGAYVKVPTSVQLADGQPPKGAQLTYEIEFVKTGTHYINLRYWAANSNDNSVYIAIDGVVFQDAWNLTAGNDSWAWERAPSGFTVSSPGVHTVTIYHREDGLYLDKAVISSTSDFTVADFGPEVTEYGTSTAKATNDRVGYKEDNRTGKGIIVIEAEAPTNNVAGRADFECRQWIEVVDTTASGGTYMTTDDQTTHATPDKMWSAPRLDFEIEVTEIATHYIHIRHRGGSTSNKFYLAVNHHFVDKWKIANSSPQWSWESPQQGYSVTAAGTFLLSIIMRDDNTPIDKIIITTDRNYTPSTKGQHTTEVVPPNMVFQQTGVSNVVELSLEKPSRNLAGIGEYEALRWTNTADATAIGERYAIVPNGNSGEITANNAKSANAPVLEFNIDFVRTGTHYISTRHRAPDNANNSYTMALDGVLVAEQEIFPLSPNEWVYQDDLPTINITTPGIHTFSVYMREDGTPLDHIVISSSPAFNAQTMPIELLSFTGQAAADHNALEWSSIYEDNTATHLVQRSETGHDGWQTLGRVAAAGNSNTRIDYSFEDRQAPSLAYYRIVTVDLDESESISSMVSIVRNTTRRQMATVSVYPNPATEYANLSFEHPTGGDIELRIATLSGRTVATKRSVAAAGTNRETIMLDRLPAGTYVITGSLGGGVTIAERLVVQH